MSWPARLGFTPSKSFFSAEGREVVVRVGATKSAGIFTDSNTDSASRKYASPLRPLQVPCFSHSCSTISGGMICLIFERSVGGGCVVLQPTGYPPLLYCGQKPCNTKPRWSLHWALPGLLWQNSGLQDKTSR